MMKKEKHHLRDAFLFGDPNERYFELFGGGFKPIFERIIAKPHLGAHPPRVEKKRLSK